MASPSAVGVAGMLGVILLASCVGPGPPAPPASPLPPRPQELRLDGVDPCGLLSKEQLTRLGLNQVGRADGPVRPDSASCQFARFPEEPDQVYAIGLYMREPAAPALQADGSRVVMVAGFGAVEARAATADPERSCFVYVDVAEGQHLRVLYGFDSPDLSMNRQLACERARVGAELMVQNLSAQRR